MKVIAKAIETVLTTENRPGLNPTMVNAELKEACQVIRDHKDKLQEACEIYNKDNANKKGFSEIDVRQVKLKVVETENKLGHRSKVLFNTTRTKVKDKVDELRIKLGASAEKIISKNDERIKKEQEKIVEKFDSDTPKRFRR